MPPFWVEVPPPPPFWVEVLPPLPWNPISWAAVQWVWRKREVLGFVRGELFGETFQSHVVSWGKWQSLGFFLFTKALSFCNVGKLKDVYTACFI